MGLMLLSCTPAKRLSRLIKNHPELATPGVIHDTVTTQEVKRDTTFKYFQKDSVIIREGKLVMKYYYNSKDSTVFLQGQCLPDTIYRDHPFNQFNIQQDKGFLQSLKDRLFDPLVYLFLIAILIFLFKK